MDDKELSDYREESKMEFTVFLYRILVVAVCVFFVLGVVFYFKGRKTKSYKESDLFWHLYCDECGSAYFGKSYVNGKSYPRKYLI